jgi:hypothetical protein
MYQIATQMTIDTAKGISSVKFEGGHATRFSLFFTGV